MATSAKKAKPVALIVDDDPLQIQILTSVLGKFGITTDSAATAKAFLGKLTRVKPDLCLVDLNIDTLGAGFSVIEAMRKVFGRAVNIIAISAVSERKAIETAIALGADDFIVKPLDRHVLAAKISRYISTEQLMGAQSALLPIPGGGSSATVYVDLSVSGVDERGVVLTGAHLLSKGVSIHLDGALIHEITGSAKPALVRIVATWIEKDGVSYGAFAEFDGSDLEALAGLRSWLQRTA